MKKEIKLNWMQKITDKVEAFFLNILSKIGLKKIVEWYNNHKETMRYLVFGGLTTVVNIIIFIILKKTIYNTIVSNTIAWIVSVIFAYITNKYCVFYSQTSNKKDLLKELSSFISCRLSTLAFDELFMYITIDIYNLNDLTMKIIANIVIILLNYILSKMFVFKKNK